MYAALLRCGSRGARVGGGMMEKLAMLRKEFDDKRSAENGAVCLAIGKEHVMLSSSRSLVVKASALSRQAAAAGSGACAKSGSAGARGLLGAGEGCERGGGGGSGVGGATPSSSVLREDYGLCGRMMREALSLQTREMCKEEPRMYQRACAAAVSEAVDEERNAGESVALASDTSPTSERELQQPQQRDRVAAVAAVAAREPRLVPPAAKDETVMTTARGTASTLKIARLQVREFARSLSASMPSSRFSFYSFY